MKPKTGKDKVKNKSDDETDNELELVLDYDSSDESKFMQQDKLKLM